MIMRFTYSSVTYGSPRKGEGTTTYSGATSIGKIGAFRGPESSKKVYMATAGVHGFELEGIAGVMNPISILETGKDLNGTSWPEIASIGFILIIAAPFRSLWRMAVTDGPAFMMTALPWNTRL
jgi:hypothetical protein